MSAPAPHGFRLVPAVVERRDAPTLDDAQARVVAHPGGPLLMLAGPGTGKTTTLVEAIVDRIVRRGTPPERILALTFSRRAAADLRRRIGRRVPRGALATPRAMTFHAFCHQLVRSHLPLVGDDAAGSDETTQLRLLTAPEQDFRVREILDGTRVAWPEVLRPAVPTHAFAGEVADLMSRARRLGLDPEDLVALGREAGREEWAAVGAFYAEYLDVTDAEQVYDYTELVHRSRILLADDEVLARVRAGIDCVFVDEYQDTDPAQLALLRRLVPPGGDLVVAGDPDQSIYAFRGADPRAIADFPDTFRTAQGDRAPVVALARTRRFGPVLAAASRRIAARLPLTGGLPVAEHRALECAPDVPRGRIEVLTYASPGAEAEHIAELLRAAHLHEGVAWTDMAVLVRSGRRALPVLSRALIAGGVPIEVAGDEIPLAAELAVRPLLLALSVAADGGRPDPDQAVRLLTSPLGGLDSLEVRRLGRALREAERAELGGLGVPRLAEDLVARALAEPDLLAECTPAPEIEAACRLAALLDRVRGRIEARASASTALWELWEATGWPQRLQAASAAGGDAGRRADRDLDAVCALFDVASQSEEKSGHKGVTAFLADVEGQQIPADSWREGELRGSGVRLLTAHRSKGLEWQLVVVAGVQEGVWPDTRRRGSVLEADRLSSDGVLPPEPTGVRLAEERRLFYVACTRATRRLVVTAVAGTEGENDQPSRFLTELGLPIRTVEGRPRRPLSLTGLVGELRATTMDPGVPPRVRDAAVARLARLADATDDEGRVLVPAADPARWWGLSEPTHAPSPVVAAGQRFRISGSQLTGLLDCPRQWFLTRKAKGDTVRTSAASFGSVVHVLIEHATRQEMAAADVEVDRTELLAHLDQVWQALDFDANWLSAVERLEAEAALERFLLWERARPDREVLGVEVPFRTVVDCGAEQIDVTGTIDRVEQDAQGRIHVVDFKTGRSVPQAADVLTQDQLGLYQLAVRQGAVAELTGPVPRLGGGELVYLRVPAGANAVTPKVFTQPSLDDQPLGTLAVDGVDTSGGADPGSGTGFPTWVHARLATAAAIVREERFAARVGPACRYCPVSSSCPARGEGRQLLS